MTNCTRPDCEKELHTGKSYCSTRCAALDRKRIKTLESTSRLEMPIDISKNIVTALGENGKLIVGEVNTFLAENPKELAVIPFPTEGITYGDWVLSFDGEKEYRPGSALDFDTIEMMLRSGPVIFSMEMKRAQVFKVFSEGRFKVESPDKELAEVANAALKFIMPKMAMDFTFSAFAYGVSFQEEIWENKTKYELGMSTSSNAKSPFTVPRVPNSVKPTTVPHIRRTPVGNHFNGFVQDKPGTSAMSGIDGIIVDRDAALVIPLNEHFRNLWGESFLKPLYPIWLWYEITLRTMARYMERMAMPVTVAKAPSRSSVLIEGQTRPVRAMDLALALAGNVSKSNAVAIPSDRDEQGNPLWELSYLTADEKGQAFIQVLEFLQQEMIRAGLSADRSLSQSSGGTGSYNIGELHAQASSLTSEMILQQFVFYLNLYFMPSFSLYNRGRNGPPIWLKTQAIDLAERALLMQLIGVAGNAPAGQEFFWMIDWEMLGGISNIPMLTPEQIDERKKKIQDEQMDKMEQQQKIMAANAAPIAKGGASAFPEKDKAKTPEPTPVAAKSNGKLEDDYEYVVESLLDGRRIPWILSEEEVVVLLAGRGVDEETIRLYNEAHDRLGRFASKSGQAIAGISGTAELLSHAAKAYVGYKISKGADPDSNVISHKFGNKQISLTYNQLDRGATKVIKVAPTGRLVGGSLILGGMLVSLKASHKPHQERVNEARQRAEREWAAKEAKAKSSPTDSWPQAKQDDFKNMYRSLSKKYHPDVNKAPDADEVMSQINNMHGLGDFDGIKDLFTRLERVMDKMTIEEIAEFMGIFLGLLKEFLASGNEYLVFDIDEGTIETGYVVEDGELILDRPCAYLIFRTLEYAVTTL